MKTYESDKPNATVSIKVGEAVEDIIFAGGRHTAANEAEENAIEASSLYKSGHIRSTVPVDPRLVLEGAVKIAQAAADKAEKAAEAAEAARAEINALPKRLRANATAAKYQADAATKALADFDATAAKTPAAAQ